MSFCLARWFRPQTHKHTCHLLVPLDASHRDMIVHHVVSGGRCLDFPLSIVRSPSTQVVFQICVLRRKQRIIYISCHLYYGNDRQHVQFFQKSRPRKTQSGQESTRFCGRCFCVRPDLVLFFLGEVFVSVVVFMVLPGTLGFSRSRDFVFITVYLRYTVATCGTYFSVYIQ